MPLLGLKLFGCTVKNFSTNLGWGSSKSSVRVSLVQDTLLGDLFTPPTIGTPVNISFYALNFSGLLQRYEERKNESANPEYDILIEDPREILEGTEIITGAYNGSTFGVPNLINAYGYWENASGFGASLVNESGMPWYLIKNAVQTITAGTNGSYGGPLTYKGITYKLDLSQIPIVPNYYRIQGGTYTNLMRAIEEVCSDSGCDFFVELIITNTTRTIKVRTVSRRLQPAPGVLTSFIQTYTNSGAAKRSSAGLEARNEITSSFLVGGEQTTMFETSTGIHQFFGFDVLGQPLVGNGIDYSMTATLNCSEVFDILGTNEYDTDMLELLNASSDIATWKSYIRSNKPSISTLVGLDGMPGVLGNNPPQPQVLNDFIQMGAGNLAAHNTAIVSAETDWKANRIFRMVQKNAHLLGKQFLVEIPFVLAKVEPDTTKIVYSHEPTNAGYKETGSPLNLDTVFQDNFSPAADGRYQPFCLFGDLGDIDLRKIDVGSYVVGTDGVYVKCSVDEKIIWLDELTPCVLVHVNEGLDKLPTTGVGNENLLPQAFGGNQAGFAAAAARGAAGAFSLLKSTRPLPAYPTDFAIPLKSNILTYGPWYAIGGQGKVHYSQDPGLVPWNYGGTTIMNLTGASRVTDAITWQQYGETGDIEIPGAPIINLGDLLQGNGPTLTNMDIQYGAGGVTTTYRFHTFTNKTAFGNLGKTQFDRIKKLALNNQAIRRDVRQAFNRLLPPSSIANAQISFLQNEISKELGIPEAPRSPHGIITACSFLDATDTEKRRVGCTTASVVEALRAWQAVDITISGENISYQEVSSMSMDGLYRPFKTKFKNPGVFDTYTSTYTTASGYGSGLSVSDLDPFQDGNDIDILLVDDNEYSTDAHNYISGSTHEQNQKPVALRAPLVLTGWGYSTDDAWIPNTDPTGLTGAIENGYLRKSHHWKTGPLETLWDDQRGVWTSFGNCLGITRASCPPGSGVEIDLYSSYNDVVNGRRKRRKVYNFSSDTVASGSKVTASFVPEAKSWYINDAINSSSSGNFEIVRVAANRHPINNQADGYVQIFSGLQLVDGDYTSLYIKDLDSVITSGYYGAKKVSTTGGTYGNNQIWAVGYDLNPFCDNGTHGIIKAGDIGTGSFSGVGYSFQTLGAGIKNLENENGFYGKGTLVFGGDLHGSIDTVNYGLPRVAGNANIGVIELGIRKGSGLSDGSGNDYLEFYDGYDAFRGITFMGPGTYGPIVPPYNQAILLLNSDPYGPSVGQRYPSYAVAFSGVSNIKYGISYDDGSSPGYVIPGVEIAGGLVVGGNFYSGLITDSINALQSQISALQSDMSTAQSNISTLQSDMSTAQSNISDLQSRMTTAEANIADLQSRMTSAESTLANHESRISALE